MTNTLKDINKKTFRITSYRRDANGYHDRYAHEWIYSNKYFSRWNFLLLAMNQLINHLDKLPEMTIIIHQKQ